MGRFTAFMQAMGEISLMSLHALRELFRWPFELRATITQLELGGVDSWSITVLTAVFTGMVMASQFAIGLEPFGASMYTGNLVGLGIVRELGPVLTALLVGGRVGAGFTAELGSMAVTEQIDAMKALGADPVRKLVLPRILAMLIALPMLTVLADLVGCFGGALIVVLEVDLTFTFVFKQMADTIDIPDLVHGLGKSAFFGYFIAIIGCWNGMRTFGGTEGVGQATTNTVVYISVCILMSDFLLTRLFLAVYG